MWGICNKKWAENDVNKTKILFYTSCHLILEFALFIILKCIFKMQIHQYILLITCFELNANSVRVSNIISGNNTFHQTLLWKIDPCLRRKKCRKKEILPISFF